MRMSAGTLPTIIALTAGLLCCSAAMTWAQSPPTEQSKEESPSGLFVYVDDAGSLHVVSSLDLVPAAYKSRARPASLESASGIQAVKSQAETPGPSRRARQTPYRKPNRADPKQTSPESPPTNSRPVVSEGIDALRTEHAEALDELGQLEEGWREDEQDLGEKDEPTAAQLEERSDQLTRRIEELERRIEALKRNNRR